MKVVLHAVIVMGPVIILIMPYLEIVVSTTYKCINENLFNRCCQSDRTCFCAL